MKKKITTLSIFFLIAVSYTYADKFTNNLILNNIDYYRENPCLPASVFNDSNTYFDQSAVIFGEDGEVFLPCHVDIATDSVEGYDVDFEDGKTYYSDNREDGDIDIEEYYSRKGSWDGVLEWNGKSGEVSGIVLDLWVIDNPVTIPIRLEGISHCIAVARVNTDLFGYSEENNIKLSCRLEFDELNKPKLQIKVEDWKYNNKDIRSEKNVKSPYNI